MISDEMSKKFKKALRIAVNVGCGFEGDAEDAVSLLGLIEANEARIAELEAAQRWIPVSERLPDNWKPVLTIDMSESTRVPVPAFYDPETSLWTTHLPNYDLWVTHWMPLPEPPIVYGKVCEE